jgi:WD40 repeat protein
MQPTVVFSAGGTVQASGGIYITRPADEELFQLCMEGTYAHVLTSRQMGKSSLRVAVSQRLRREGVRIASIDLTSIGTQADSAEQWYVSFLETVEKDLHLTTPAVGWWEGHEHLTPTDRFTRYLLEVALAEADCRVVIFVDEIDSTLSLPFSADDFFAAVRALFNVRGEVPDARRLSFVLIGSVAPGDLIRDSTRTPFNIGRGVTLTDFTEDSAQPLAAGLGLGAEGTGLLHHIFNWTGGHPYLTQRLCMAAATNANAKQENLDGLVRRTFLVSGDKKDSNLEWVRDMLTERAPDRETVLTVWREVVHGRRVDDEEASVAKAHLKLTGVVRPDGGRLLPRNKIYTTAFDEAWVLRHLPQELERALRLARYKKLAVAAGAAALVLAVLGIAMGVLLTREHAAEADATAAKATATEERDNAQAAATQAVTAQRQAEKALGEVRVQRAAAQQQGKLALAAAAEANVQRAAAQEQQKLALTAASEAKARQLAAQAEYLRLRPGQLTLASLLGLESVRRLPVMDNRDVVAAILDVVGRERARLEHQASVNAVAISPDGTWLATASADNRVRICDASTGRERARLEHQDRVNAVAISPDGTWLVTASADNRVRTWDASTGGERASLEDPGRVNAVAISPDGKWLATASADNTARIWDASTGRERASLVHQGSVNAVAISPDGKWLATASDDVTARIWDSSTGRERARLVHQAPEDAVAISPDGKWLATASADNTARIWDASTGRERARLVHQAPVNAMAISPDGKWLVTASDDTTARIWDASTGRERARLEHQDRVNAVAISPDGTWLATASGGFRIDNTARIWDASTGRERARLEYQAPVNAVAISPDGKWLATASDDKTARIWDAASDREYLRLEFEDSVRTIAFSKDTRLLLIARSDVVTMEPWQSEDLVRDLCDRMIRNLTLDEWKQYIGAEPYHRACSNLPAPAISKGAPSK